MRRDDIEPVRLTDLSPGLDSISVAFAKALLNSPALLKSVAAKELSHGGEKDNRTGKEEPGQQKEEGWMGRISCALSRKFQGTGQDPRDAQAGNDDDELDKLLKVTARVYDSLGLDPAIQVEVPQIPLDSAQDHAALFEDLLREALELYLESRGENEATAKNTGEDRVLTLIFLSSSSLTMPVSDTSTVADAKDMLSRSKGLPCNFFRLMSSTGMPALQASQLVQEVFPDLVATVLVVSPDFVVGDRIKGHWSNHATSKGATMEENWYGGVVHKATEEESGPCYTIFWEDNTISTVRLEGTVWRTAYGGVIYAIEKEDGT